MKNQHLVPQVVVDCAESMIKTNQDHMKTNYIMRLEAIRDYCDEMLRKSVSKPQGKKKVTR
jgi:hypothetical protein